jgi:hypothetical protein
MRTATQIHTAMAVVSHHHPTLETKRLKCWQLEAIESQTTTTTAERQRKALVMLEIKFEQTASK